VTIRAYFNVGSRLRICLTLQSKKLAFFALYLKVISINSLERSKSTFNKIYLLTIKVCCCELQCNNLAMTSFICLNCYLLEKLDKKGSAPNSSADESLTCNKIRNHIESDNQNTDDDT
jgi:hypothetical protein